MSWVVSMEIWYLVKLTNLFAYDLWRSSSACANACVSPLMEFMIFCLFIFPNYTECPKKTYVLGFFVFKKIQQILYVIDTKIFKLSSLSPVPNPSPKSKSQIQVPNPKSDVQRKRSGTGADNIILQAFLDLPWPFLTVHDLLWPSMTF